MDTVGNKMARAEIAMIKVVAPNIALNVIDRAIQVHGGAGVSGDTFLAHAWASIRTLRLADGPDEVHMESLAKLELRKARVNPVGDFDRDGFLVLEDFASAAQCDALIARARQLVQELNTAELSSIFTTREQERTADDYFLGSGDKIRFFLEEDAIDASGQLRVEKNVAINKIGHALHDLDPVFAEFSRAPAISDLVDALGVSDPRLIQSMYIFKQPRVGGEVTVHQDSTFLYTDPPSVVGLWFALEDATVDNGCLWALPGGHCGGLRARFRRKPDDTVVTDVLDPTPWPDAGYVPLEVARGTLIALHGALPHKSEPNRSATSRHAYTLHVIDGAASYAEDNWLQRAPEFPASGFGQAR